MAHIVLRHQCALTMKNLFIIHLLGARQIHILQMSGLQSLPLFTQVLSPSSFSGWPASKTQPCWKMKAWANDFIRIINRQRETRTVLQMVLMETVLGLSINAAWSFAMLTKASFSPSQMSDVCPKNIPSLFNILNFVSLCHLQSSS